MSQSNPQPLIDPTMLFRFEVTLQHASLDWTPKGMKLPESCRLMNFGQLADRPEFADVRMAWDKTGIGITVSVRGKKSLPWCRDSRLEDSDGVHVWIDTRCSPNIHRATRYCHRFLWMPAGAGPQREQPIAALMPINRARENPKATQPGSIKVHAIPRHDGYDLSGYATTGSLTGYDPQQFSRLGFYYAVIDRELGWQTLTLGPEYPVVDDPSLWCQATMLQPKQSK